jgi:osmoprotectant transport system ATP-binding protein
VSTAPPTPAISLRNVTKTFDGAASPAVRDLTLEIETGTITVLVGPSGCGKTTTLRMINRLIEPTSGQIFVGGVDVMAQDAHELRRGIGYVIQQTGLFPHQTIAANIATVPRLLGWTKARIATRVRELTELVGLDVAMLDRYPSELSGGQQQRAGVARALAADPPVLLMDEPYSAVDPVVRERLQDELLALQDRMGKTIVLVTHDIDEAIKLGNRVALLDVGGILAQYGPPDELLHRPASEMVAGFLGRERGLKRLALRRVGDVALAKGVVVEVTAPPAEAIDVMDRNGVDWVAVIDNDQLLGWVGRSDVEQVSSLRDAARRPFASQVTQATTLREALDSLVISETRVAVVVEDGVYLGMLTIDQISESVT